MDAYEVEKVIGEGSFGKALLCRRRSDRKRCIIKQISLGHLTPKEARQTQQESTLLERLNHPNIVSFWDSFVRQSNLFIVMEFADGGDLDQFIKRRRGRYLTEVEILELFVQIALAIKHTHDRKILHRDLKPGNIFLTSGGLVKLGDFGVSKVLKNTGEFACTQIGTPYYMSPEIMDQKRYNSKTDIWSLGCILYEIMCLKLPFEGTNMQQLAQNIQSGRGAFICHSLPYSKHIRELAKDMLLKNSVLRPGINAILGRPFIKSHISCFLDASRKRREFSHTVIHGMQILNTPPVSSNKPRERENDDRTRVVPENFLPRVDSRENNAERNAERERVQQMIRKAEGQAGVALDQHRANEILNAVLLEREAKQKLKEDAMVRDGMLELKRMKEREMINADIAQRVELFREEKEKMRRANEEADTSAAEKAKERQKQAEAERKRLEARNVQMRLQNAEYELEERRKNVQKGEVVNAAKLERRLRDVEVGYREGVVEPRAPARSPPPLLPINAVPKGSILYSPLHPSNEVQSPSNAAVPSPSNKIESKVFPELSPNAAVKVNNTDSKAVIEETKSKAKDNLLRFENERLERQAKADKRIEERTRKLKERESEFLNMSPISKQLLPLPLPPRLSPVHDVDIKESSVEKYFPPPALVLPPKLSPPAPPIQLPLAPPIQLPSAKKERTETDKASLSNEEECVIAVKTCSIETAAILESQSSSRKISGKIAVNALAVNKRRGARKETESAENGVPMGDPSDPMYNENVPVKKSPSQNQVQNQIQGAVQSPHEDEDEGYSPFIFSRSMNRKIKLKPDAEDKSNGSAVDDAAHETGGEGEGEGQFSVELEVEYMELFAQMQDIVGQKDSQGAENGDREQNGGTEEDDDTFEEEEVVDEEGDF